MENDAFDALDATTTTGEQEFKAISQKGQTIRQLKVRVEGIRLRNSEVFKTISENAANRLKMTRETPVARAGKTVRHTNANAGASNGENADERVKAKSHG